MSQQQDRFQSATRHLFADLAKDSRLIWGIVVGVIAVGGITAWVSQSRGETEKKGQTALFAAREKLKAELLALVPASPVKAETKEAPESEEKRLERANALPLNPSQQLREGVAALEGVAKGYPKSRAGYEARAQLGQLFLTYNKPDLAERWYLLNLERARDPIELALAHSALAQSKEAGANWKEAIQHYQIGLETYEKAFSKPKNNADRPYLFKGDFLLSIGRCYEGLHDKNKALSAYDQVIKQFPGSRLAQVAESAVSRLK